MTVSLESEAKAKVTVAVTRSIVVAIGNTTVGGIVVPATAPIDAIRALLTFIQYFFSENIRISKSNIGDHGLYPMAIF